MSGNCIHMTQEQLHALKSGTLSPQNTIDALEHIGSCQACAQRFSELFQASAVAPPQLEAEIVKRIAEVRPARTVRKESGFIAYAVRVGLATCAALALVVTSIWSGPWEIRPLPPPDNSHINKIALDMHRFTDQILIKLEGN